MPTYSYRCTSCENQFDVTQSFTDNALTSCETCGGSLRKIFNTIGVTFNGSGFYRTDSRAPSSTSPSSPASTPPPTESTTSSSASAGSKKEKSATASS